MKSKIILFGAGIYGREAYEKLNVKYNIKCFADNDSSRAGKTFCGIPIVTSQNLHDYIDEETDIVISSSKYNAIEKQLEDMGIDNFYIFIEEVLYQRHVKKNSLSIQRCTRCVMDDSSDEFIIFDNLGHCNYCNSAVHNIGKIYFPNQTGAKKLNHLLEKVIRDGKDKPYDCIMGLSGGLDSSYLMYLGYKWGLRILVIHMDDGYGTEISKSNIRKLIAATGFDYEIIKPDQEQYNDLVLAYMKAGVPNIAVPQDNMTLAYIYKKMKEYDIPYFFSGGNFALECILQKGNTYSNLDVDNIVNIHKKFGTKAIDKLEFISLEQQQQAKISLGIEEFRPLNYIDYNRNRAFQELTDFCGFEYYGRKHLENILTAFIQLYWFPKKFGVDKRTSHLSSMIINGQMTREEALKELSEPLYKQEEMDKYISIIKENLNISDEEFAKIMSAPTHQHEEYLEIKL